MKRTIVFAALLACTGSAAAQTRTLTLDETLKHALAKHPAIELAAATAARAHSGVREARAGRLPSLNIDANLTRFEEPMVVAPLHGFDPRNPPIFDRTLSQSTLALGYTLFDAGRGARIDRAEALADAAATHGTAARMQVLADATRAYLRLHTARQVADANAHRISALEGERQRAAQLVQQGRAARVVLLRAEAALSSARAEGVAANSDVENAENDLARQIGMKRAELRGVQVESIAPADETQTDVDALRQSARDQNPELQRAQRQIAAAEAAQTEARGLYWPRLQLGGRFVEYVSAASRPQGEWQGGVQLSYPLFTGGIRGAANERAQAEIRVARAEYELVARRVDDTIDRAGSALTAARARVQALEAAVAQFEEVVRIDRLALDAGAGVQSDYLNAEADLFRARAALSEARALELSALIELARLGGYLSESWIAQHVEPIR